MLHKSKKVQKSDEDDCPVSHMEVWRKPSVTSNNLVLVMPVPLTKKKGKLRLVLTTKMWAEIG